MRDLYKNPMFYYILAPILIGMWPLLVWAVYLPGGQRAQEADEDRLVDAQASILRILELDPDRLDIPGSATNLGRFTYAEAIDRAANVCNIPSSNYNFTSGGIVPSGGKETQQARLSLDNVGIVQIAKFLSTIQSTWVNLTCEKITLKKKEGMRDQWDVDLDLKYSY